MAKVALVGAGCSHVQLLTLKAKKKIEEADCILYDALVDPSILALASKDCRMINVGKRKGKASYSQDQIHALLFEASLQFQKVVRLKGGDPYVFGRGGEEGSFLFAQGIDFEVVPGISSCLAGLSYAGIPITYRGINRGFRVYTAFSKEYGLPAFDFHELCHTQDTVVFLMGKSQLETIVRAYQKEGVNKEIALISHGSFPDQQVLVSTIDKILQEEFETLPAPLLIVVGEVIQKQKELNWFMRRPLFQKRIFYPRLSKRDDLVWALKDLGADLDSPIAYALDVDESMLETIEFGLYQAILLTSPQAIQIVFEWMRKKRIDLRNLPKIGVVGKGSAAKLESYGLYPAWIGDGNALSLIEIINEKIDPKDRILIPHSAFNTEIFSQLKADVDLKVIYRLKRVEIVPKYDHYAYGIFTSEKAVQVLEKCPVRIDQVIAIGEKSAQALKKRGFERILQSQESTYSSIIETLKGIENV